MWLFLCAAGLSLRAGPVEITGPGLRGAQQPQVAVGSDGRIHAIFGKGAAIYYTGSVDGAAYTAPVKIGEIPGLALGKRRGPRIAASGGRLVVAAISHDEGRVRVWGSGDGGATWTRGEALNTVSKSACEGLHGLAGNATGCVAAVWLDGRDGSPQIWGRISRDGGRRWSAEKRIYASPDGHVCECCHPSVAVDDAGRIVVMWRNWLGGARDMFLASSEDGGATFGPAQKLGEGTWKLNACPMDGGAVTFGSDGRPLAVWRREAGVFLSRPGAAEERVGMRAMHPVLAIGSAGPIVAWQHGPSLMLKRGEKQPARISEQGSAPALAGRPGGPVVMAWESNVGDERQLLAEVLR